MPCIVEPCIVEGHKPDLLVWYCCNCGDGPMTCDVSSACTGCNNHMRCGSNAYITPPDSPPRTCQHRSLTSPKLTTSINVPEISAPNDALHTNLVTEKGLGHNERPGIEANVCCSDVPDSVPSQELLSIQTAIEQHTQTVLDFLGNLTSTPEERKCPSGEHAAPGARQGSTRELAKQQSSKRQPQRNAKKESTGQGDGKESEVELFDNVQYQLDLHNQHPLKFACHFVKYNPHRYRHEQSCSQGYPTIPKLR
jgi:hypothetical protein